MPYARITDPQTSHEAAASVLNLSATKQAILDLLKFPATDEELVNRYQSLARMGQAPTASPSGIRSRRAELVRLGLVKEVGFAKSASGRKATVWSRA